MKCKFTDKPCDDRYFSSQRGHQCRLPEWKRKLGVCPYDKTIKSRKKKTKHQQDLNNFIVSKKISKEESQQ